MSEESFEFDVKEFEERWILLKPIFYLLKYNLFESDRFDSFRFFFDGIRFGIVNDLVLIALPYMFL